MDIDAQRRRRFLDSVVDGKREVRNLNEAKLLITAVCDHEDRVLCMAKLCGKPNGLIAVRQALLTDLSGDSLNHHAAQFILYFATENTRQVASGKILCDLLSTILKPALLWNAYQTAAAKYELTNNGIHAFASLVSELLLLLPPSSEFASLLDLKSTARGLVDSQQLHKSDSADVRRLAYKIEEAVRLSSLPDNASNATVLRPGGRHDNDFVDFRKISIFPTKDELLSSERPYMLLSDEVLRTSAEQRVATHLDNQFRLLREDMLADLREDLKRSLSTKVAKRRGFHLRSIQFSGVNCGDSTNLKLATVAVRCFDTVFRKLPDEEGARRKNIAENKTFLKHGSFGCILASGEVVAFATIDRNEELLAKTPPVLLLRLTGEAAIRTALAALKLKRPHEIDFVAVHTPYFAYEPVLRRLQHIPSLPLADVILGLEDFDPIAKSPYGLDNLAAHIRSLEGQDISSIVGTSQSISLDHVQTESLGAGLTQAVSLIQGPPGKSHYSTATIASDRYIGTGKSFIGAILAKLFLDHVMRTTVLVLCYTNHALDQFLEDILDMGVEESQVLRLGSKSTARTEPMALHNQPNERVRLSRAEWSLRQYYRSEVEDTAWKAVARGSDFSRWKQSDREILDSLEFDEQDEHFFNALSNPENDKDMLIVGSDGKTIDSAYLFRRWIDGKDAGLFNDRVMSQHRAVWEMTGAERQKHFARWSRNAVRAFMGIGLVKYRSTPQACARSIASVLATPVKATIMHLGSEWSVSTSRISAVAVNPSMIGIDMSIKISAYLSGLDVYAWTASFPFSAQS